MIAAGRPTPRPTPKSIQSLIESPPFLPDENDSSYIENLHNSLKKHFTSLAAQKAKACTNKAKFLKAGSLFVQKFKNLKMS